MQKNQTIYNQFINYFKQHFEPSTYNPKRNTELMKQHFSQLLLNKNYLDLSQADSYAVHSAIENYFNS